MMCRVFLIDCMWEFFKWFLQCCLSSIIATSASSVFLQWWLSQKKNKVLVDGAIRDLNKWNISGYGNASCPFLTKNIEALCDAKILSDENQRRFETIITNAMICARNARGNSLIGKMKNESQEIIKILEKLR